MDAKDEKAGTLLLARHPLPNATFSLRHSDVFQYYLVNNVTQVFKQFEKGLGAYGFLEAVRENKEIFRPLFLKNENPLDFDTFNQIYKFKRSPLGSNRFKIESRIIHLWMKFLEKVQNGDVDLTFEELLVFGTGLERPPPLGFSVQPTITFLHGSSKKIEANTCSLELRLPVLLTLTKDLQMFTDDIIFSVRGSVCFGKV